MNHAESDNAEARRLWAQLAASLPPPGACPAPGDLAAYADGRSASAERETLESHLAACADCLAAVREARSAGAEAREFVPPAVLAAARSLVPATRGASEPGAPGANLGWRISEWLTAGRWVAATAASIVICFVAYRAGTQSGDESRATDDLLAANMSFGVFDDQDADDDLDLLAMSLDWQDDGPEVTP